MEGNDEATNHNVFVRIFFAAQRNLFWHKLDADPALQTQLRFAVQNSASASVRLKLSSWKSLGCPSEV